MSALGRPRPTASATSRSRGLRRLEQLAGAVVAGRRAALAGDERDEPARDGGGEHAVAGVDELDGAHDLGRRRVLEQEAGGARAQGTQHELVGVEGREDDDRGRVGLGAQQAGGGDAVELWHADVHEDDVGAVQVDRAEHAAPVVGLAHHLDALGAGQHHPQPRAHERVVVDEQDADLSSQGPVRATADRRAMRASRRPREGRAQDEVARLVGTVLELAARELDALGQPDEAGAGAGERERRGRRDADRAAADDLDHERGARLGRDRDLDRGARRVLARVGQALLDDAIGRAPEGGGQRARRRARRACSARASRRAGTRRRGPGSRPASAAAARARSPAAPSRSTPMTSRSSSSAAWAVARMTPAASATSSAEASGGTRARRRAGSAARPGGPGRRASRARCAGARLRGPARRAGAARPRGWPRARAARARARAGRARTAPSRPRRR